jgi:hypothetical protein
MFFAWSDVWMGTRYLGARALNFKVASADGETFFYNTAGSDLFVNKRDGTVNSLGSCVGDAPWPKCLEAALRGGLPMFNSDPACSIEIRFSNVAPWKPSPAGPLKSEYVGLIRMAALKAALHWGNPGKIVCNDFNTHDPDAFAICTLTNRKEYLIVVNFDRGPTVSAHASHVEEWLPENAHFIAQIQTHPLQLTLRPAGP